MENTSTERIQAIAKAQKEYFVSGATLDIKFRKQMLKNFLAPDGVLVTFQNGLPQRSHIGCKLQKDNAQKIPEGNAEMGNQTLRCALD